MVWSQAKRNLLLGRKLILACSGGADSVALVRVFAQIWPRENLLIAHYHHGDGVDQKTGHKTVFEGRDHAAEFVKKLSDQLQIEFILEKSESDFLQSEAHLRKKRMQFLKSLLKKRAHEKFIVVFAHHSEDLLETRVIRLIRGTGQQGLPSMSRYKSPVWRPFLESSKKELKHYLKSLGQDHMEDLTNLDQRYLRNWLRVNWLPQLERKRPGAIYRLSQSLHTLAQRSIENFEENLTRQKWWTLSAEQKNAWVAKQFLRMKISSYTAGQIKEVVKQLDKVEKRYTFEIAQMRWIVDVQQIRVERRK